MIMRVLMHSPKDTLAGTIAFAGVLAIVVNAMFMQSGRHPAPMFNSTVVHLPAASPARIRSAPPAMVEQEVRQQAAPQDRHQDSHQVNPMPRPRPVGAGQRSEAVPAETPRAANGTTSDPIGQLVQTVSVRSDARGSGGAANAVPAKRIMTVQQILTEFGFGQIKPTGQMGPETKAAIERFERTRGLPVTGQISPRMTRELTVLTGLQID